MDFAIEVAENLDLLEAAMLGALREVGGGNTHLVGIIFRYAHNTKGLFAMAGEEACRDAIHELETSLDMIRNGKYLLSDEFGGLSLDLINSLRAAANDEGDEDELFRLAGEIKRGRAGDKGLVATLPPCPNLNLGKDSMGQLMRAHQVKQHLYVVEKNVSGRPAESEWRALPIFEDIPSFGTLIAAQLVGGLASDQTSTLQILLASDRSADEIELLIFDPHYEVAFPALCQDVVGKLCNPQRLTLSPESAPSLRPRVLIVDDEGTSRRVLQRFFRGNFDCEVVCNGQEGLFSYMLALEEAEPFNLVCLDVSMPVLDGAKALTLIRRMERERGIDGKEQCPVLMISAEKNPELIAKTFFASCDRFLHKPIDFCELRKAIEDLNLKKMVDLT